MYVAVIVSLNLSEYILYIFCKSKKICVSLSLCSGKYMYALNVYATEIFNSNINKST